LGTFSFHSVGLCVAIHAQKRGISTAIPHAKQVSIAIVVAIEFTLEVSIKKEPRLKKLGFQRPEALAERAFEIKRRKPSGLQV
jgi:hypothetical protein